MWNSYITFAAGAPSSSYSSSFPLPPSFSGSPIPFEKMEATRLKREVKEREEKEREESHQPARLI